MGPLGWPETVFIVILALLLFGPKKLPELGRTLGKAITEFRRASAELKSTFDREMRNLEREAEVVKEKTGTQFQDSYNYDYSSYDTGTPYNPETQAIEASNGHDAAANGHDPSPQPLTEGASATQGVPFAAADNKPTLTVTPAPGNIASGSLSSEHTVNVAAGPVTDLGHIDAAQDTSRI
jgi:sec-independent protein translocase protein TatA